MGIKKAVGLLLLVLILFSCGDDREECLGYENAPITNVAGPSTATVGETVAFEVEFSMRNGCGAFERIVENTTAFTRMIAVEAEYEGCACYQVVVENVTYDFTPEYSGIYELNFRTVNGDHIVKTVTV